MIQRGKERVGKFVRGTFNLGVESAAAVGGAWAGDRLLQTTHMLNLSSGVTTEFAQMSVLPIFALVKAGIDRKNNALVIPSLLAFAGAVGGWGYFHNQDAMVPLYAGGLLLGGVGEYALSRRSTKSKSSAE